MFHLELNAPRREYLTLTLAIALTRARTKRVCLHHSPNPSFNPSPNPDYDPDPDLHADECVMPIGE